MARWSVGNLIREYRERRSMNQKALAEALGLKSRGSIQNWEADYDEVPAHHYPNLVRLLGIPPRRLLDATPAARRHQAEGMLTAAGLVRPPGDPADGPDPGIAVRPVRLPVVGTVSGDPDTRFLWEELKGEEPLDFTGCRAVRVEGDSMSPVALSGQYAIYHPDGGAGDGDLAVVRLATGETLFKRVYFERDLDRVILVSVKTGHRPRSVPADGIHWIHRVVGIRF